MIKKPRYNEDLLYCKLIHWYVGIAMKYKFFIDTISIIRTFLYYIDPSKPDIQLKNLRTWVPPSQKTHYQLMLFM
jgi:hypothetical protein